MRLDLDPAKLSGLLNGTPVENIAAAKTLISWRGLALPDLLQTPAYMRARFPFRLVEFTYVGMDMPFTRLTFVR